MQLAIELAVSALMVPILALIHGLGLMLMSRLFRLEDETLAKRRFEGLSIMMVALIAISLFAVHATEIGLMGALYWAIGAARDLEHGLLFSASAYTTAGSYSDYVPDRWQLVAQAEALLGLLLIGWSTAYLVRKIEKLRE